MYNIYYLMGGFGVFLIFYYYFFPHPRIGLERGRVAEQHQCGKPIGARSPTGDPSRYLGICPDWESDP